MNIEGCAVRFNQRLCEGYPNYARAFDYMTYLYICAGRAEEAVTGIEKAMRINLRFLFWYFHARAVA